MLQQAGQAASQTPTTWIGLATLIVLNVGMWIREWRKHKDWKNKNGQLSNIEDGVDKLTTDVEVIKTKVEGQTNVCADTRRRYDKAIETNQKALLDHINRE